MTDREMLIDLLGADVCKRDSCDECKYLISEDACIRALKERLADHLIANGVTIARKEKGDGRT